MHSDGTEELMKKKIGWKNVQDMNFEFLWPKLRWV